MKTRKNPISPSIPDHHQSAILVHCSHAQLVDVTELVANPRNPNKHSDKQVALLAKIIRHQGWRSPITVSNRSGFVVTGHGRLQAAILLGEQLVPVDRQDFASEADEWSHLVADNRIAELADADKSMIADLLKEIDAAGLDMDLTGFDMDALDELLAETNPPNITEDEVPDVPVDPITKPGDLWILGQHRVLCGDSTKAEDVGRLMNEAKADLCFTSPPYNAGNSKTGAYNGGGMKRTDFKKMYVHDLDHMTSDEYKAFLLLVLDRVSEITTESSCVLWNVAYNANSRREYGEVAFGHSSLKVQETIVWDKGQGMNVAANHVYSRSVEFVFLLAKTEKYYSNQKGGVYWNVWRISTRDGDNMHNGHGASFPVALPSQGITQHSCEGDTVYEPFCGSGTTLIAAEQLGRKCYGMEISPAYCDVIVKRWENLTKKQAVLCND
jgi:DNA modification methylase